MSLFDERGEVCRPFVIGMSSKQFLHFGIVIFEQDTSDLFGGIIVSETIQDMFFAGQAERKMQQRIDGRVA